MARRRMFSLDIVETDAFLDLPFKAQLLYFHLGMHADDDGFIASPRRISSMIGATADDLKCLTDTGFVIGFESGVCCIRDWHVHNYIRPDRYTPTRYQDELFSLSPDIADGIPDVIPSASTGKDRTGQYR